MERAGVSRADVPRRHTSSSLPPASSSPHLEALDEGLQADPKPNRAARPEAEIGALEARAHEAGLHYQALAETLSITRYEASQRLDKAVAGLLEAVTEAMSDGLI